MKSLSDLAPEQLDVIDRLYEKHCLLIAQAGAGKTVCSQTAAQELIDDGHLTRVLIVAPLRVCELTWAAEWRHWAHLREPALAFGGDVKTRKAAIESGNPLVVINFENLAWFFGEYGSKHDFDGLIIDESSKLADAGGTTFKALRGARTERIQTFKWRVCMSATPVHEGAEKLYTQMMIVDGGESLGTNKDAFLRRYFMQADYQGRKWNPQPGGIDRLVKRIESWLYMADTEDYEASLPELIETKVPIQMPPEGWDAYDAMANKYYTELDGKPVEAVNAGVVKGKLQQICCGAVYTSEDRQPVWIHKAKFRSLEYLVGAFAENAIIVYQFDYEREFLRAMLPQMKVLADAPVEIEAEWNAGKLPILGLHPNSAGHGTNLQYGGCRMIWLSPIWSADKRDQTLRRIRRRGSPFEYIYNYILTVENSVEDLEIEARSDSKLQTASAFMDHLRSRRA